MTQTPPALQQVVLRCLEKAPEQRYPSMADLARDLVPFSSDPHQAQVLVERMTRTLRRSQAQPVEWNSNNSPSGPMQKVKSGERPAEGAPSDSAAPLGSGQIAAAAAPPAGSGTAIPRLEKRSGSGPSLSETLAVARPGKRSSLLIAGAVIVAAAIGVAISLVRTPSPAASPPVASPVEPARAVPPAVPAPTPQPASPQSPPSQQAAAVAEPAAADRGSAAAPAAADRGSAAAPAIGADRGSAAKPPGASKPPVRPGRTVKPGGGAVKPAGDAVKPGDDTGKPGARSGSGDFFNCARGNDTSPECMGRGSAHPAHSGH